MLHRSQEDDDNDDTGVVLRDADPAVGGDPSEDVVLEARVWEEGPREEKV